MQANRLLPLVLVTLLSLSAKPQMAGSLPATAEPGIETAGAVVAPRINFYIVNKPKTCDLFSRLSLWRARKQGMTRHEKFIVLVVTSSHEAATRMAEYLDQANAMIGSLWFDTHGRYVNGYSSFILGEDEFSYKTIYDTNKTKHMRTLAAYCDEFTKIGIGSCYGGATFEKPAHNGKPASKMNGDSLIIGMAHLLPRATVFGSEGWVMSKPGIFKKHSYALAGYPLQRRFKDEVFRPVWERMGIWHSYSTTTQRFDTVNTLSLSRMGSINVKEVTYLDKEKSKERLERNLKKLQPGLLKH